MKKKMETIKGDLVPVYKSQPPFMNFESGFGYIGVVLQEKSGEKIQCHFCGGMYRNVAKHAWHKHGHMDDTTYRKETGLNLYTPLVAENTGQRIRQHYMDLTDKEKLVRNASLRGLNRKVHASGNYKRRSAKGSVQNKNMFGTCELQAKALFDYESGKLGRIPLNGEMSGSLKNLVYTRFGSYEKALRSWGVSDSLIKEYVQYGKSRAVIARAKKEFFPSYGKEQVEKIVKAFVANVGRWPSWEEARRIGLPTRGVFQRIFGTKIKKELEKIIPPTK